MKKLMYFLTVIIVLCCTVAMPGTVSAAEQWLWPVPSIGVGQNISTYFSSSHEGIDIYGGANTPIVASRAGTVCRVVHGDIAGVYLGAGNAVVIDHGNGVYSHYAHLNSTAVSVNQYVDAGTVIGYMGSTGNSTGVHLHFAIANNSYGGGGRIDNNPGAVDYVSSFIVNGTLDVNGRLDGANNGGLGDFGTCDVYINGSRVADDVTDYCTAWPAGTSYEVKDIKAKSGYSYEGSGSYSGTGPISFWGSGFPLFSSSFSGTALRLISPASSSVW